MNKEHQEIGGEGRPQLKAERSVAIKVIWSKPSFLQRAKWRLRENRITVAGSERKWVSLAHTASLIQQQEISNLGEPGSMPAKGCFATLTSDRGGWGWVFTCTWMAVSSKTNQSTKFCSKRTRAHYLIHRKTLEMEKEEPPRHGPLILHIKNNGICLGAATFSTSQILRT